MEVLVQSNTKMYSVMDICCISALAFGNLTPGTIVIGGLVCCRPWATVPELSLDKSIQIPRNFIEIVIMLILQIIREEEGFMMMSILYKLIILSNTLDS